MVPGVKSVFADEDGAEHYLAIVRDENKPIDRTDKTPLELLNQMKTDFIHNYEKAGMGRRQFHDAIAMDEASRHLLYEHSRKFRDIEEGMRNFLDSNKPRFDLRETLEAYS